METKTRKNVWLIILILVFVGSHVEDGRSAEPNVPLSERTISFPADYSMGELSVRDWGSEDTEAWTVLGEARGQVTVPAGRELRLKVPSDYKGDFSPFAALGPSDLHSLVLDNTKVADTDLAYIKGLTTLRLLSIRKRQVLGRSHPLLGKSLGDLKFTSLKGEQVDLYQYKGKVVLVDFWATWCGPCIADLPDVKNTYDKYHDIGFEIIGISLDRDKSRLENFIRKNDIPWPQHFDGKGWKNEIAVRFNIHSIPSTFLLDRQGIVRYANLRGSDLEHAVTEALEGFVLHDAQITNAGLVYLKDLTSLETLLLDNTQITDEGLEHLKGLTSLKYLNVHGTKITHSGIKDLKQALPNCNISQQAEPKPLRPLGRFPDWRSVEKAPLHKRILFAAVIIPIVCFLSALLLKIVTGWAVKSSIPYWAAYKIEIIAAVIAFIIRVPFDVSGILWILLLSLIIHLFVYSIIYGQMIKHPDTNEPIGLGKGLLICFYLMLIWIPLTVVLSCVFGCIFVLFRMINF